jgi:glutamyl-tRNA synthetase
VLRFGFSMTDAVVPMEMLLAENRKLIDPIAKHLFFVRDPVRLMVKNIGVHGVRLRLHPTQAAEFREYEVWEEFYISKEDADTLEAGSEVRLKDFMAVRILSKSTKEITAEPVRVKEGRIVQWVSGRDYIECSVLMPEPPMDEKGGFRDDSLKTAEGYVESYARRLKEHEIVQFERFGYCILDDKKRMQFIFISK